MSSSRSLPIACTLSSTDLRERLATISQLSRDALQRHVRSDLRLELFYDPAAAENVRTMIAAEQRCCAFLTFAIHDEDDSLHITITAPPNARGAADELFAQFISTDEGR